MGTVNGNWAFTVAAVLVITLLLLLAIIHGRWKIAVKLNSYYAYKVSICLPGILCSCSLRYKVHPYIPLKRESHISSVSILYSRGKCVKTELSDKRSQIAKLVTVQDCHIYNSEMLIRGFRHCRFAHNIPKISPQAVIFCQKRDLNCAYIMIPGNQLFPIVYFIIVYFIAFLGITPKWSSMPATRTNEQNTMQYKRLPKKIRSLNYTMNGLLSKEQLPYRFCICS